MEDALLGHPCELIPAARNALLQLVDRAVRKCVAEVRDVVPLFCICQTKEKVRCEALVVFREVEIVGDLLRLNIREECAVAQPLAQAVQLGLFFVADAENLLVVNVKDPKERRHQGFLAELRGSVDVQQLPHLNARQVDVVGQVPCHLDLRWAIALRLLEDGQESGERRCDHHFAVTIRSQMCNIVQLQNLLFWKNPFIKALQAQRAKRLVGVPAVPHARVITILGDVRQLLSLGDA
mmetsp:Transcript_30124/g.70942  ORF Transcript_30124/g.70942 Transcript_30124/m.70942 type:complete len:237 (+) Transcript_30124:783-1493(+)